MTVFQRLKHVSRGIVQHILKPVGGSVVSAIAAFGSGVSGSTARWMQFWRTRHPLGRRKHGSSRRPPLRSPFPLKTLSQFAKGPQVAKGRSLHDSRRQSRPTYQRPSLLTWLWGGFGLAIACLFLSATALDSLDSPVSLDSGVHSHAVSSRSSSLTQEASEPVSHTPNRSNFLSSLPHSLLAWSSLTIAQGLQTSPPPRARAELWHFTQSKARLAHTTELKVAVSIPGQGADLMQRWQPTIDYLNREIKPYRFSLLPMYDDTMEEAVKLGKVDFVIPHSGLYIELESRFNVNRIATFRNLLNEEPQTVFGSVVFSRSDRQDIESFSDLRDKTLVAVRNNTVGDWLGVERELVEHNLKPTKDLAELRFVGNVRQVMSDVRRGAADVGVLRADQLKQLEQEGHAVPNQFKILHPRYLPQYPLPISTRLYAEPPFAALSHVPQDLVQRVAIALLSIPPESEAANQLNSAGWSIPLSYQPVNDVYRRLRLGPYTPQGFDLGAILWHYKRWIFTVICLILMGAMTIYIQRREISRRRRSEAALEQSRHDLQQRTQELETALSRLQSTQAQLIQTEKMSSLGLLMAGIAHEINNPVNFIHGNVHYANQYIRDILQLLKLYQDACNYPPPVIRELEEEIDTDFVFDDLPKLLSSMQLGSERIREIVHSLKIFSRVDEAELKAVDLHQGIDSTLLILQHRLKAKHNRSAIAVVKQYGEMPAIECYAGQLNQVFMNILSNAIDALDEPGQNTRTIWIETCLTATHIARITFKNNGPAIPDAVQQKLFNPFFTTKPIGKGTGLGMSISYQIVTEKHGGSLRCQSSPEDGVAFIIDIPIHHRASNTAALKSDRQQSAPHPYVRASHHQSQPQPTNPQPPPVPNAANPNTSEQPFSIHHPSGV